MTAAPKIDAASDQPTWDVPKVRRCLRCKDEFRSEWSGERVCPRCKNTNAWRSGEMLRSRPTGNKT